MPTTNRTVRALLALLLPLFLFAASLLSGPASAEGQRQRLLLRIGETKTIDVEGPTTVIPGNEKVCQVLTHQNTVVLKAVGEGYSTVTIGGDVYSVTVFGPDSLQDLQISVEELLKDTEGVEVLLTGSKVVLDGLVYTQEDLQRVDMVVKAYEGLVISLVRLDERFIRQRPMFRISFDFVEVDRQKLKDMGMVLDGNLASVVFNWIDIFRNGPTAVLDDMVKLESSSSFTKVWETHEMTVLNGEKDSYLFGGSILIPVSIQNGGTFTNTLQEKEFGTKVEVTPKIDRVNNVELAVTYEVSDIISGGTSTPYTFSKKTQTTTVLLQEGQSLALAGVVKHRTSREIKGLPWLSEIPILGFLFGSKKFKNGDTDGVIFITPRIVKPDGAENRDLIDRNLDRYRAASELPI